MCSAYVACNMLIAMAIYFTSIYKHIYFWKKPLLLHFLLHYALSWCCVQRLPAVILDFQFCWFCAFVYYKYPRDTQGRFIENVKKKKFILSLWDFSVACVIILCVHKNYLNNPLCTVSKSLVLNVAISSLSSNLKKKCFCPQSYMYNLLQCKKQNPSFVSFWSCGSFPVIPAGFFRGMARYGSKGFRH